MAYREFFDSIKFLEELIIYHTTMDPRYIKLEEYNCQMKKVVSSRCKRNERAKRAHSLYIIIAASHITTLCFYGNCCH